jgi:hypothetical protein
MSLVIRDIRFDLRVSSPLEAGDYEKDPLNVVLKPMVLEPNVYSRFHNKFLQGGGFPVVFVRRWYPETLLGLHKYGWSGWSWYGRWYTHHARRRAGDVWSHC